MISSVPGETPDIKTELLDQLRDLVPSVFLDGELDKDALLNALDLNDDTQPSFSFSWPGIDQARHDAKSPTTATLVPDAEASLNWPDARDVLIEGDNLQVLKLLKNGYSRTVKLIYIDPPYNTGDTFTYNDKFAVSERQYLKDTGQVDVIQLIEDQLQYGKFPLQLTRPTIVSIVREILNFPDHDYARHVLDDPERWARIVANAIRIETVEQMVRGITYEPMDEETWWDAEVVFLEVEQKNTPQQQPGDPDPKNGVKVAPEDGVSLYDHVEYDSHVERAFASQLDNNRDHVKLFTKLPRRFKVRTPVGEYSPDWAIVYDDEGTQRLYLVRETKDTRELKDLP